MFRADLLGAFEMGLEPTLDFQKLSMPASLQIPTEETSHIHSTIRRALSGCAISESTLEIFLYLGPTARAANLSALGIGDVNIDAATLVEDYFYIEHRLITLLCTRYTLSSSDSSRQASVYSDDNNDSSIEGSSPTATPDETPVDCNASLEAALALTALLYCKVWNPSNNEGIFGFTNALELLTKHLQNLLHGLRNQSLDAVIDPNRFDDGSARIPPPNAGFSREAARPALLWTCLAADHLVRAFDMDRHREAGTAARWMAVYKDLLVEAVGTSAAEIDSIAASNLEMCPILDFGRVMNQSWPVCLRLRQILGVDAPESIPRTDNLGRVGTLGELAGD
jgi:hypothetical protein